MTSYAETQRLPRANLSDFSAAQTEIWDHVIETRKLDFMPNMFAVMGQSPEALRAVAAVGEHVRWHSALDNDLREMVICTVAQAVGNIYDDLREMNGTITSTRCRSGSAKPWERSRSRRSPRRWDRRSASAACWRAVRM